MRIVVIGAGGLGGYYGGLLARAGEDVTFVARGEHGAAMRERGLAIKSVMGDFTVKPVKVIETISEIENPDLVLVCTKTYHLDDVGRELGAIAGPETLIITTQNGLDADAQLARHVSRGIIVPGCVFIVTTRTAPGVIEQTAGPRTVIFGSRAGEHGARLDAVEAMMRGAGIEARHSREIGRDLWKKFVFITCFAGMTAWKRAPFSAIVERAEWRAELRQCLDEALAVAEREGAGLGAGFGDFVMGRLDEYKGTGGEAVSSLQMDVEQGRPTEIEAINGALLRLARQHGIGAPVNERIYESVKGEA